MIVLRQPAEYRAQQVGHGLDTVGEGDTVNKAQLIDELAHRFEGSRTDARHALDSVLDVVQRTVAKGEGVTITGFGTFEKVARPARTARNPRTGESVKVKKTAVPRFRAGTGFKQVTSGAKKLPKLAATGTAGAVRAGRGAASSAGAATRGAASRAGAATGRSAATQAPSAKRTVTSAPSASTSTARAAKAASGAVKSTRSGAGKAAAPATSTASKVAPSKATATKATASKTAASKNATKATATKTTATKAIPAKAAKAATTTATPARKRAAKKA